MADFTDDRKDEERIRRQVRRELDDAMRDAALIGEFTVGMPDHLRARPPLTDAQYEVAVALNTLARFLKDRASTASTAEQSRWEGLSDAAAMTFNAAGYLGLPQLHDD